MQAKRAVLETDSQGRLKFVPTLPPDAQIEAIFLVLEPGTESKARTLPPEIAGLEILGDIMAPAIDPDDWGSMVILLDTHAWMWWVANAPELPSAMKALIDAGSESVGIASISCLEVAWLAKKGRLALPISVELFFESAIDRAGLQLVPLTPKIAARSAALPDIHRDPVDRVLIATAIELDAALMTKDSVIPTYPGVRVRWNV